MGTKERILITLVILVFYLWRWSCVSINKHYKCWCKMHNFKQKEHTSLPAAFYSSSLGQLVHTSLVEFKEAASCMYITSRGKSAIYWPVRTKHSWDLTFKCVLTTLTRYVMTLCWPDRYDFWGERLISWAPEDNPSVSYSCHLLQKAESPCPEEISLTGPGNQRTWVWNSFLGQIHWIA